MPAPGQTQDYCQRGHRFTEANTYARPGKPKHRECLTCRKAGAKKRNIGPVPRSDELRFFRKVTPSGECWQFTSLAGDGYGRFWFNGRTVPAHRWAYTFLCGEIPPGLQLDHLCRNRGCVNPWHLEPVTARVNTLRGLTITAANALKSACPAGHEYEGSNLHVTPGGKRVCRACHRVHAARHRQRKAA